MPRLALPIGLVPCAMITPLVALPPTQLSPFEEEGTGGGELAAHET
jgi:hypothetical protein